MLRRAVVITRFLFYLHMFRGLAITREELVGYLLKTVKTNFPGLLDKANETSVYTKTQKIKQKQNLFLQKLNTIKLKIKRDTLYDTN